MKFSEIINETTTTGSIATGTPAVLGNTQKRSGVGTGVYGNEPKTSMFQGKKTNKKYANSAVVKESKMKELAMDLKDMDNGNFQKKYKKSKEQMKLALGDPHSKKPTVHEGMDYQTKKELLRYPDAFALMERLEKVGVKVLEVRPGGQSAARFLIEMNGRQHLLTMNKQGQLSEAHLEEDDLILVPGQGHRLKSGFIPHDQDRTDHEVEMAKSDLFQAAKNAKQIYEMIADISEDEGLPGWIQEKIIKANDYLNSAREFIEHKQVQEMQGGVIAAGGVGESLANWNMSVQSLPRTSEWKRKAITAIAPGAMGKEYTFDTEQEAIQHFTKDGWEKIKAGVPTKSGKPWEVIYADKISEAQSLGGALKNSLAKAEPGSKLDKSIKAHNAKIKAGEAGTLKNAPTGYHFDKKGYCRLGDK